MPARRQLGFESLTPEQLDCLRLASEGLTAKEIAIERGWSHHTVEARLGSAKRKLLAADIRDAVRIYRSETAHLAPNRIGSDPASVPTAADPVDIEPVSSQPEHGGVFQLSDHVVPQGDWITGTDRRLPIHLAACREPNGQPVWMRHAWVWIIAVGLVLGVGVTAGTLLAAGRYLGWTAGEHRNSH